MSVWTIKARDPLVVRDGRPKAGDGDAGTLPFPIPGTLAGVVRTRAGSDVGGRFAAHGRIAALREISVRGPLLAGAEGTLYVPRPRDALFVKTPRGRVVRALRPLEAEAGRFDDALMTLPVGLEAARAVEGKAPAGMPSWWRWESFARWLDAPLDGDETYVQLLLDDGITALPREHRVHVKIGAGETAEEGMLFETAGLRLLRPAKTDLVRHRLRARPLSLSVAVSLPEGDHGFALREGTAPFAGERRLVRWTEGGPAWPTELPGNLSAALGGGASVVRVRVVLMTPGAFREGWRPGAADGELCGARDGVTVSLVAALVPRPETISGWDFALDAPKATRRVVPAGSVYWLDLEGDAEARLRWAKRVWMQNVSDSAQDRRDGYGLAALGVG
jgi:CRISPR-associated protein Cmr3